MAQFGTLDGKPVELIRLKNEKLSAEVLSYGATLRALYVPDRNGKPLDVVLGFDTIDEYLRHDSCFGATIGPNANRIGGAACSLGGRRLRLDRNDGENNLHSGSAGLDRKLWEVLATSDEAVTLLCVHPNGLGGIPGDLRVAVTYWLDGSDLLIEYRAVSDRDTLCNLTNHSYFNLDGHDSGSVLDHRIQLFAKSFTPIDAQSIPTGAIRAVSGTAMDLTKPVRIGTRIDADLDQLRLARGFDHNWVVDRDGENRGPGLGCQERDLAAGPHRPSRDPVLHGQLHPRGPSRQGRGRLQPPAGALPGDPGLPRRPEPPQLPLHGPPGRERVGQPDAVPL